MITDMSSRLNTTSSSTNAIVVIIALISIAKKLPYINNSILYNHLASKVVGKVISMSLSTIFVIVGLKFIVLYIQIIFRISVMVIPTPSAINRECIPKSCGAINMIIIVTILLNKK